MEPATKLSDYSPLSADLFSSWDYIEEQNPREEHFHVGYSYKFTSTGSYVLCGHNQTFKPKGTTHNEAVRTSERSSDGFCDAIKCANTRLTLATAAHWRVRLRVTYH